MPRVQPDPQNYEPTPKFALVGRADAGRLLTIMAAGFGTTVIFTRLYLVLTGYPQIGNGTYHIAHALFGGLLLVFASLIMLLYANRGVLTLGAVLAGVGTGLFVDEIGKFITRTNDYFFPLAAPLIYIIFMLVVLVARYAANIRPDNPHEKLLTAIDALPDLVNGNVTREEISELEDLLEESRKHESSAGLAAVLHDYLASHPELTARRLHRRPKILVGLAVAERYLLPKRVVRSLLVAVLFLHVVWSFTRLGLTAAFAAGIGATSLPLRELLDPAAIDSHSTAIAWFGTIAAEAVAVLLYVHALYQLTLRDDWEGIRSAIWATMVSLTAVNALSSYFHQFVTVIAALGEGALLLMLLRYRVRFGPR
ncbi:hypothetical protein [Smaragdicoccus niigatensis]|uniref:hypothetical protein n=1 Tax=Smaragdicoccus niigatensis TaxID=359359 RepID=UPI0003676451|nr:hypothetical protein [Smaragdicoccus niigatensis]